MNDKEVKKLTKVLKVSKLLSDLPAFIWNEQIAPILAVNGLKVPKSNFNVYRYIKCDDFIDNAEERIFIRLFAHCLKRCGMKIEITKNNNETVYSLKFIDKKRDPGLIERIAKSTEAYEAGRKGMEILDVHTTK